jgi:type II secretory pathway component GspD/PulD (secretin)
MSTRRLRIAAAALALLCTVAAAAHGRQSEPQQQQPQQPSDNYVNHTSFKNRIFEVRHRDPESLLPVLRLLTSGHKGASISADRAFRTITVRDFPENIASVEDALKRLDTPEGSRPEVELRMYVLIASNNDAAPGQLPADLKDVVTQLQSTLNFRGYQLLTTILQRAKERSLSAGFISGEGSAQAALANMPSPVNFRYNYQVNSLTLTTGAGGQTTTQIGGFNFHLDGGEAGGKATIRSDVGVREGERVVVGTAGMRDRALILVLTAKLIK